jgi:thiaminase
MKRYKLIENLTGVYFSQDYEYFGETGAEVMAEYRKASTPAELEALRAEIVDFMHSHLDLETDFPRRFGLHAQLEDFGSTEREFLEHVLAALK